MALVFIFLTSAVTTAFHSWPGIISATLWEWLGGPRRLNPLGLLQPLFLVQVAFTFLGSYTFARVSQSVVRDLRQSPSIS